MSDQSDTIHVNYRITDKHENTLSPVGLTKKNEEDPESQLKSL